MEQINCEVSQTNRAKFDKENIIQVKRRVINTTKMTEITNLQDGTDEPNSYPAALPANVNQPSAQKTTYTADIPEFVIVKFKIGDTEFGTLLRKTMTANLVKEHLADVLELREDFFILEKDNIKVEHFHTLADFYNYSRNRVTFNLVSSVGKIGEELIKSKVQENIPTLEVITVHLGEEGDNKDIIVEIEKQYAHKEFLGGYRNKLTNAEFHNAVAQTRLKRKKIFEYTESGEAIPMFFHRDTQTPLRLKEINISTSANKATQMWRSDLYITSKTDKIMTASTYRSSLESSLKEKRERAAILIQRFFRSCVNGKRFRNIINLQRSIREDIKKQKLQILKEQADRERAIITGAAFPVKRDDFYMLYLMVGNWWKKEWYRISNLRSGAMLKAEGVLLLDKEVQLLQTIEKHRCAVKQESLKKQKMDFLEQTSRPITFKNARGNMASIDDLDTQRAREFKEIYSAMAREHIPVKDRIDLLLTFRELFVTHYMDYEYSRDLVSLIEREIDLLTIGTKQKDLRGLRRRIEQLYMYFVQQEQFNPKAVKYKKPSYPKTIKDLFQCSRCLKLVPASKFPVHVRMKEYDVCTSCVWLHNIGHKRVDMSPFIKLLKNVQNSEMEKCCESAICFILQPIGMGYLTKVIWHGHSAISECSDMSKLRHMRWLPDLEWAPWNTILLTDQEAKCHACIPDVFKFYDRSFIESVRQKHILARQCFVDLLKMDHDIRSSGVWSSITDSGPYLHPSHGRQFASDNEYDKI